MAKRPPKNKRRQKEGWLSVQLAALTNAKYKSETYRQSVLLGQAFGMLTLIAGFILSIAGVSGSIEWLVESSGFRSRLTNATPGVFFVFVGMIIIWRYKPNVSHDISFDRRGGLSDRSLQYTGWRALSSRPSTGSPEPARDRITYREEQRGTRNDEPENRK